MSPSRLAIVLVMFSSIALAVYGAPEIRRTEEEIPPGAPALTEDIFMRGKVREVIREEKNEDFGVTIVQSLLVEIQHGAEKGREVFAQYEMRERPGWERQRLSVGDKVVAGKHVSPEGDALYYVSDHYRLGALWGMVAVFFILVVLLSRRRGLLAFIGLGFSMFMVAQFIVPRILAGQNPFFVSIIGTAIIACVSLFLAHGVHRRTTAAFFSTILSIVFALACSSFTARLAHLFGLGTEEAFYLQYAPIAPIDLRGLFLGGVIIGMLGILDDVTTAQSAAVEEIHHANPSLSFKELYVRGASVGREHIVSLVNTLVLAYTGASLPLLLLFFVYTRPAWVVLNSELVMEEAIRALSGSITLLFAVPLTTIVAALMAKRAK